MVEGFGGGNGSHYGGQEAESEGRAGRELQLHHNLSVLPLLTRSNLLTAQSAVVQEWISPWLSSHLLKFIFKLKSCGGHSGSQL